MSFIFVAIGGALGAVLRYSLSLIIVKSEFPLMTFVANFAGCFLIGLISGFAQRNESVSPNLILFLKTGFCGGFTTFSTFSLEAWTLIEKRNYGMAGLYAGASLLCCIAGVILGQLISRIGK